MSLLFALMLVSLVMGLTVAVDMAGMVDARARLQRAVDNAALSGAAAYSVNAAAAQTRAVVSATSAFCEMTAAMPNNYLTVAGGAQACGGSNGNGPTVSTQIGGFMSGTPGVATSGCSATNPVVGGGVTCGFIVTVSASATTTSVLSTSLGLTRTVSATGIAANPFIDIGSSIRAQMLGSAYNTNAIWLYPLLLDANGNPDFSTNQGAIPGISSTVFPADATPSGCSSLTDCGQTGTAAGLNCTSDSTKCSNTSITGCTNNPLQFVCGAFTMLANTFYNTSTNPCLPAAPCQPNGAGNYPTIIQGTIQNPQAPSTIITATTPIGIAFQSYAGGAQSYGYGGYQANPANGCYYPGNAVYTTVAQVFGNAANNIAGSTPSNAAMDWSKVTHWFYSSYLANNYPPSEGEILSQSHPSNYTPPSKPTIYFNTRIPSMGTNSGSGFTPTLKNCSTLAPSGGSYDEFLLTNYPMSGASNGSLFILKQALGAAYVPPASTGYAYTYYTPGGTPGYQYAALTCQAYSNNVFTFYWNDMGGSQGYGDDLDYNNGVVRITCAPNSTVRLIG